MRRMLWKCCLVFALMQAAVPLHAQQTPPAAAPSSQGSPSATQASNPANEKLAQLDQRVTAAQSSADTAWMLVIAALVLLMTLWVLVVYAPLAHMVWGKGGLLNASLGGRFPTLDFAGGTVVHISSGVSALVCALYLGKRSGFPKQPMPPHSMVLSFIGACLLWVGWFGFNARSALASNSLATSAFVATHFAAAAAALSWSAAEWIKNRRPSALGAISGAVAGPVAITPAAGFFGPRPAPGLGLIAGGGCY